MSDNENILMAIAVLGFTAIFLPVFLGAIDEDDREECELEWVECTDDDRLGDCEEHTEEIVTGPYWNEITETKITLRKQACKEQGD